MTSPSAVRVPAATGTDCQWPAVDFASTLLGAVALVGDSFRQAELMRRRHRRVPPPRSSFAGFRFPREVIVLAVRWYLRYGLSYRDVEELLVERGIAVDHVTVYRWVQRFTPLLIDVARPYRHAPGDRWFVDETYVKVAGQWIYLYRAIDQFGQVIDVLASEKRDMPATCRFFTRALEHGPSPTEVITDKAAVYPPVLEELAPGAWHHTESYANNRIESDHDRLKSRLRPMSGLKQLCCAQVISAGRAFVRNFRHGHYELRTEETINLRVLAAFDELVLAI
jgi:transposase, IS6 family